MTCIIAVKDKDGKLVFASDAGGFEGWSVDQMTTGKVFRTGQFLMALVISY